MHSGVRLLDTTLRDGSYVVDFQFTAKDTAVIAAALENAGVPIIEVGHGLGLNASNCGKGRAAEPDEAYLEAAASALKKADWGVFFIPGIGRAEDIRVATDYGMKFIRIGTNVTEVDEALSFIGLAKELGLWVSSNFMKTYALSEAEVARRARLVRGAGADVVSVVDSAGGMLPDDVAKYLNAIRNETDITIGYHGHDNLGLAIANALRAVECGAAVIDTSLLGIGRSAGNAVTEIMILVLKKKGIDLGIDANELMDVSERIIKPMIQRHKHDSISITSGYAQFHSSYLGTILKYAERYHLDPRDLIIHVCKRDQVQAPDKLVKQIARQLFEERKKQVKTRMIPFFKVRFRTNVSKESTPVIKQVLHEMKAMASKYGKYSVFNIVAPFKADKRSIISRFIQENFLYVIGSAEVCSEGELKELLQHLDGQVDYILVDAELKNDTCDDFYSIACRCVRKSKVLSYKDTDVWVRAAYAQIAEIAGSLLNKRIVLVGWNPLATKLAICLAERGADVVLTGEDIETLERAVASLRSLPLLNHNNLRISYFLHAQDAAATAFAFVGCTPKVMSVTAEMVEAIDPRGLIVDVGIGSLSPEAIKQGNKRGIRMIRVDMRAALASEVANILGTQDIVRRMMGRTEIAGLPVVAGGLIGGQGDIVVDSIDRPAQVIGIADGRGYVIYEWDEQSESRLQRIEAELLNRMLLD